ncbi:MAG: uroporphyrinogen decarboxylase family protein [Planctomycetota bacterium]
MNSRERVARALNHEEADRIPVDFWASPGLLAKLRAETGMSKAEFLDAHDVDFRYIDGPAYVGPRLADGEDLWGVPRTVTTVRTENGWERYTEVREPPLAGARSVDDIEGYEHWPSPDWFDYGGIEAQCDAGIAAGRVVIFMGDRLNRIAQLKPAMYLRGVEQILTDLATRPDLARRVIGRIRHFYTGYLERILEAANGKIDIVLTGDDFGSQTGPLVSPAMWDEFLRHGFERYVGIAHEAGCCVMHHTCGSVLPIIARMIDCGLDVLQSLQPGAADMDPALLKARFGRRLCFQGGVCIQHTLPHGTREDIRREVKRLADTMGRRGGYIFCTSHNIQADVDVGNVTALMGAYKEFGRY